MSNQNRNRLYNRLIQIIHRPRSKANHQLRARRANGQGIHSPYIFRFITTVLNSKWPYYAFEALEDVHQSETRHTLFPILKKEPHRVQRMIFRIVNDQQPSIMLEIGNQNGIDTQYMVNACPKAICKSITYAPNSTDNQIIDKTLLDLPQVDFVLFNAPATCQQRMNEFKKCLQKVHDGTLFVVKHNHQTPEQALAWKLMHNHPQIRASIDLYYLGILFFRNDLPKCKLRIKM